MTKITDIIKSRFKEKEDFYFKRLETCLSCDKWSLNSEESKGALYELASFGKGHCNVCGCGEHKLRMPSEECPIGKWKAEISKENVIEEDIEYKLINLSPTKVRQLEGDIFDYGTIAYNSDTSIELQYDTGGKEIENFSLKKSCGCTLPTQEKNKEGYRIKIKYDSKRLGQFTKPVSIKEGNKILKTFNIKGNVVK